MNVFLAFLSGILGSLTFPQSNIEILAWIAYVPFLYVLFTAKNYKSAILYGTVFGITYFGGVYFWITSLARWVGLVGYIAFLSLILYQTLFIMILAYLVFIAAKYLPNYALLLFIPSLWTGIEWIRSFGEFGSPGGIVGYSQFLNLPMIQIARFASVYGISFLIMLVNAMIIIFIASRGRMFRKLIDLKYLIGIVVVIMVLCYAYGIDALNGSNPKKGEGIKLALIQPNIDQSVKLNPRGLYVMLDLLTSMSRNAYSFKPDIIIWPETAVTTFVDKDIAALSKLREVAGFNKCYLITGGFYENKGKIFNSLFVISPEGLIVSRYDKEHLMPFGEYLPFRMMLYPLLKQTRFFDEDESPNNNPVILRAGKHKIGALICFESLFPDLALARGSKSDFLLTVTNDAWFGESAGAYHHIAAAPFRAIENHKYFVQVANSGISAIVDPWGRFLKQSNLNNREIILGRIKI